jgi:glycosyltransferase involved in cell wall biosynthesis
MSAPLISVVLPVYNGERYLAEAIDSVLAQTHRSLELVVVDDGSSDGTPSVLEGYGDRILRLRQENLGPGAARNAGLARAAGDFISFMDADDVLHPEKLEKQLATLEANPTADMCNAYVQNFWIEELQDERQQLSGWTMARPQLGYLLQGILVRRSVFARVGAFDDGLRVANDTDWFVRASERGMVMQSLDEVLLYRRIHKTNITRVRAGEMRDDLIEVVKAALSRRRKISLSAMDVS